MALFRRAAMSELSVSLPSISRTLAATTREQGRLLSRFLYEVALLKGQGLQPVGREHGRHDEGVVAIATQPSPQISIR